MKSECLAQIISFGERHLRHVVNEYTQHDHFERNHQGIHNELIDDQQSMTSMRDASSTFQALVAELAISASPFIERRSCDPEVPACLVDVSYPLRVLEDPPI